MAITGTGTAQDPYIITTYAELVEKAAESSAYVKVGNDINITNEYPNGNMPTLVVKGYIDGDNKVISNWYVSSAKDVISFQGGYIKNLDIRNIYYNGGYTSNAFFYASTNRSDYLLRDCKVSGVMLNAALWRAFAMGSEQRSIRCSYNLLLKNGSRVIYNNYGHMLDSCYIKIKTNNANSILFEYTGSGSASLGSNSYWEIESDNFYSGSTISNIQISNCVFDVTTNSTFTFNVSSSSVSPSIINITKAPNCTPQNKILGVTDEYWLDVDHLASIGFNAG